MFIFWIVVIVFISIVWAAVSLKKEKTRHEIDKVKKEMAKGKVIFHSSEVSDSSTS